MKMIVVVNAKIVIARNNNKEKKGDKMEAKTLNVTDMKTLEDNVPDVEVHGDPGRWVCICKASSQKQGWMKSTKVLELFGQHGCLVQVSTQQKDSVAESVCFAPNTVLGDFLSEPSGKMAKEFGEARKIMSVCLMEDDDDLYWGYQSNIAMALSDNTSLKLEKCNSLARLVIKTIFDIEPILCEE